MNAEEVKLKMGVDAEAVFDGLNSVTDYTARWRTQQKTAEQEYTQWWATELKKREEAEVNASVEAATRRNRARDLISQRAARQEGAHNAEIAGGFTPDSWVKHADATRRLGEAGHEAGLKFREMGIALKSSNELLLGSQGEMSKLTVVTFHLLHAFESLGIGAAVAIGAIGVGVGLLINKMVDWAYEIDESIGKGWDKIRKETREALLEDRKADAERLKAKEELAKRYVEANNVEAKAIAEMQKLREQNAGSEEKLHDIRLSSLAADKELAQSKLDTLAALRHAEDPEQRIKYAEAELELTRAKMALDAENARHKEVLAEQQRKLDEAEAERQRDALRLAEEKRTSLLSLGELLRDPKRQEAAGQRTADIEAGEQAIFSARLNQLSEQRYNLLSHGGGGRKVWDIDAEIKRVQGLGAHGLVESLQAKQAESLAALVTAGTQTGLKIQSND